MLLGVLFFLVVVGTITGGGTYVGYLIGDVAGGIVGFLAGFVLGMVCLAFICHACEEWGEHPLEQ